MTYEIDDIAREFFDEASEDLDRLSGDILELEKNPQDEEAIKKIFRTVHTIKGTCGFLGFSLLEKVSHIGENLLTDLREGKYPINQSIADTLLELGDALRTIISELSQHATEGDNDYAPLIKKMEIIRESGGELGGEAAPASSVKVDAPQKQNAGTSTTAETQKKESNIRIDVGLLDSLMNLTGELVLARNQLLPFSSELQNADLNATIQQIDHITTELQESVMKTRMQPISIVWGKYNRIVRDLSRDLHKNVTLHMEGEGTELDRTLIEAIKDPMTHLVRNSLDHGIATPEERKAHAKPEQGTLSLKAHHAGGSVVIEIMDDGRGIDVEKLKNKALKEDQLTQNEFDNMTDHDALHLIFRAGLSTSHQVTNVSGRGVGMDVVKTNIEKIGGSIDVQTELGQFTKFTLTIPLTLAIVPAIFFEASGQKFALPQGSLLELVRVKAHQVEEKLEEIHGAPVYRLRDTLLPLINLSDVLKISHEESGNKDLNIMVLSAENKRFGLIIDNVIDSQEIVVKPLDKCFDKIPVYSGATIMGDGEVALILDASGLAKYAHIIDPSQAVKIEENITENSSGDLRQVLTFKGQNDGVMGIFLDEVFRLEKLSSKEFEETGTGAVIQYRSTILPLIDLRKVIVDRREKSRSVAEDRKESYLKDVVVCHYEDKKVGLIVDSIYDTYQQVVDLQVAACRPGIQGTAVVNGKVIEIVDLKGVTEKSLPDFYQVVS